MDLALKDAKGRPISGAAVKVSLSMPSMAMPDNPVAMHETKPGEYTGTGRFTMPGVWRITAQYASGRLASRTSQDVTAK